MSYILDALRKADAQRDRDASRGIHAHPPGLGRAGGSAATPRLLVAIAVALAVMTAGAAGWYFTRSGSAPIAPVVGPGSRATAPAAVPNTVPAPANTAALEPARPVAMMPPNVAPPPGMSAPPANAITPPPPNVATPPMRGVPQTNVVPHSPMMGSPAQIRAAEAREKAFSHDGPLGSPQSAPGMQPPPPQQQAAAAPPTQVAAAAPPAAATGLPPDAPKVAISGGVYSPSPAQRMLIANGNVYNEGSEIAPGLVVEQIQQRTAVLKFRGTRYTVAY